MDLYISPSGYNFFWQLGVLNTIGDKVEFDNVYAISGGGIAYGYHKANTQLSDVIDYWLYTSKRMRTYEYYRDTCPKYMNADASVFCGVTNLKGFSWKKFNYTYRPDMWHPLILSASIPMVNILPGKQMIRYGIDGGISFTEKHIKNRNTLAINAYPIFCEARHTKHAITRTKDSVPLIGKKSKSLFEDSYYRGIEDGFFLLNHKLDIK